VCVVALYESGKESGTECVCVCVCVCRSPRQIWIQETPVYFHQHEMVSNDGMGQFSKTSLFASAG
jgi:hypothetical protein